MAAAHVALAGPDLTREPVPVPDEALTVAKPDSALTVVGGGLHAMDDLGKRGTMRGSILFAEPYFSWGEEGEISTWFGLGFRHLFSTQTQADALTRTSAGASAVEGPIAFDAQSFNLASS